MKRNALFVLALLFTFVFLGCEKNPITPNDEPPIVTPPVIESNLDFEVHTEVESNEIRELNQAMAAKDLMPTWVDGFRHKGGNSTQQYNEYLFNVVYTENTDDISWHLFLDLTKTQLEEKLLSFGADGFQAHQQQLQQRSTAVLRRRQRSRTTARRQSVRTSGEWCLRTRPW